MSIQCLVYVRRNADGEIRCCKDFEWHDDADYPPFIWEEGNFACDCNRDLFFGRAEDPDYDQDDDDAVKCGRERYAVRITDLAGKELYSDFDD